MTSNSLSVIDTSINKKLILRQDFNISEDGKRWNSLKDPRRKFSTLIINTTELINDRKIEIDELRSKRDMCINDVNRIRKHDTILKSILK